MKVRYSSIALSIALLAGTSSAGLAGGDWSDSGISNYNSSVPVPAPIPVPVNAAQWYLRADLGYAAAASGTIENTGYPVTTYDYDGAGQDFSFGFAIGYYITRQWRAELAGDWTNESTTSRATEGVSGLDIPTAGADFDPGGGAPLEATVDHNFYSGTFEHTTKLHSSAALVNMYYDFDTGSWFRPYIGGGLGLSVHRLRVKGDTSLSCEGTVNENLVSGNLTPVPPAMAPCAQPDTSSRASNTVTAYGLAATAMTGAAIELSPGILWDTGYRFIYRGGTAEVNFTTPTGTGSITIEDRIDHEIRTGLRFDIF